MEASELKVCKQSAATLLLVAACLASACAVNGKNHRETLSELTAADLLILPLREGTAGFDRLDRALQGHFGSNDAIGATIRLEAQRPVTLHDGYVIRRYLRPDSSRHLLVELDSEPCFPVARGVELTEPDPRWMDYYQQTGIYKAAGGGMSVGFAADGFRRECITSLEIAKILE